MEVEIAVSNPTETNEHCLYDFIFHHTNCGKIKINRNPVTSEYTLHCGCGLKICFPQMGVAQTFIMYTANDGISRTLPDDSYSAYSKISVRIINSSTL